MSLAESYKAQFDRCKIKPEHANEVRAEVTRILANKARYEGVASKFAGMPWWVVGILHSMECGLNFHQHLHNGDPLTGRTVQVPAGRPKGGEPPFCWEASAVDALICDRFDKVTDWSPGNALVMFEIYNGVGYRKRGVPSPYLWSFTDQYVRGKFTEDHGYDPEAVSKQCGCAALMKGILTN